MRDRSVPLFRIAILSVAALLIGSGRVSAEPSRAAVAAFNAYSAGVERRLAEEHRTPDSFLAISGGDMQSRLRRGEVVIERLTPAADSEFPGALLHDWRGSVFVPGAKAQDFERLMRDVGAYPRYFSPQVLRARAQRQDADHMRAWMRVRQRHVLTVTLDTAYEITFGSLDARHGYVLSRSTKIAEVGSPGTEAEHVLNAEEEHGFLWRLNSYWSYEERDGGLYLQLESISLTRSIPRGLGWAIGPYVESVPRESLDFTLRAASHALRR